MLECGAEQKQQARERGGGGPDDGAPGGRPRKPGVLDARIGGDAALRADNVVCAGVKAGQ